VRILFWGTPDFAVPSLRALLEEGHHVVGVVTQPDRPAGRGRHPRPSPVREVARDEGLPVLTPERPRGEAFMAQVRELDPELSVVVAYGHLLVPEVLDLSPKGSVNVHASLLPALRGAAPIHHAVIRGHDRTGVTIMRMTAGLDEGPILLQRDIPIDAEDTTGGLTLRLAELGAEALIEALGLLEAGLLEALEQDHDRATYAPKVDRAGARIDWGLDARAVADHIRGMDAVPGAWTLLDDVPCKLFGPRVAEASPDRAQDAAPGLILEADPGEKGLLVATGGGGAVRIAEIQPAGKRRMPVADWLRGGVDLDGKRFR